MSYEELFHALREMFPGHSVMISVETWRDYEDDGSERIHNRWTAYSDALPQSNRMYQGDTAQALFDQVRECIDKTTVPMVTVPEGSSGS